MRAASKSIRAISRWTGVVGLFAVLTQTPGADAASFTVTDDSFVGNVYTFRYFNDPTSKTVINGVDVGVSNPTLTNTGYVCCRDDGPRFWHANGLDFGFATQDSGEATMGWDFSAVTGEIAKIELNPRHFLFQFDPWNGYAVGDQIAGFVSTPASFGTGSYTELYRYTGQAGNQITVGAGTIADYTTFVSASWLNNPGLLEFKFLYDQMNGGLSIPSAHIQLYREYALTEGDEFLFRVTLRDQPPPVVPIPAAWPMFAGALAALGYIVRRRKTEASA